MELTPKQQTLELIKNASKILIITHQNVDGDGLGSTLALGAALKKLDKQVEMVCPTAVPAVFQFLPASSEVTQQFAGNKELIISINTATVKIDKLGYRADPTGNKTNILITPKTGTFSLQDVAVNAGSYKYDLIIILDASDLDRLGALFEQNTSLFYETPTINIDHHASNDYFGKVNWVDLTATSTSEILVALLESLSGQAGRNLLDEDIATSLLCGIITDTDSFQNQNTTPKSLTVAAQLVAAGARQQEIVQKIYKTKPLSTLKLWGTALTNLTVENRAHGGAFVWSVLSDADYKTAGASQGEEQGLLDDLIKSAPGVDYAILISERGANLHGSMRSIAQGIDVASIAQSFGGGGHAPAAAFDTPIDGTFEQTVQEVVGKLKE